MDGSKILSEEWLARSVRETSKKNEEVDLKILGFRDTRRPVDCRIAESPRSSKGIPIQKNYIFGILVCLGIIKRIGWFRTSVNPLQP